MSPAAYLNLVTLWRRIIINPNGMKRGSFRICLILEGSNLRKVKLQKLIQIVVEKGRFLCQ